MALVRNRDKSRSVSHVDAYPMPRMDNLNDNLVQAQCTTLDTRGYWHVPMAEGSCEKTALTIGFCLLVSGDSYGDHNVHPIHHTLTHMAQCGKFY